jgi:purine-cytosine permease-like protein
MLNFYGSSMTINTTWRPFAMVSLTLIMGTIGTALASPLYPIYQQVWHLSPSQITYIFCRLYVWLSRHSVVSGTNQ